MHRQLHSKPSESQSKSPYVQVANNAVQGGKENQAQQSLNQTKIGALLSQTIAISPQNRERSSNQNTFRNNYVWATRKKYSHQGRKIEGSGGQYF
jgi:hypothetical protein